MSRMFKQLLSLTLAIMFLVCLMPVSASAADVESIVLFSGSVLADTPWNFDDSSKSVQAFAAAYGGVYDPAAITEESYYTVTYTAENGESIYLVLQDWDVGGWAQITECAVTEADGVYTATFSAASCVSAYGSSDFSALDCVLVNSQWGAPTITSLTLHTPIASEEPSEPEEPTEATDASEAPGADIETNGNVFSGPATVDKDWQQIVQVNTSLWGGLLDAGIITEGGYFTFYFSGDEIWSIHLGLSGKDEKYGQVDRGSDTFTKLDDGTYAATFSYEDCAAAFGDDFSVLGGIIAYGNSASGMTLYRITFTPAEIEEAPANAYLYYNDADWSVGTYDAGVPLAVTGPGTYTASWTPFDTAEGVVTFYISVEGGASLLKNCKLTDLKITADGVDVPVDMSKVLYYTNDDGSKTIEIYNAYNSYGTGSNPPIDVNAFTASEDITVTFTLEGAPSDGSNPSTGDTFAFWLIPVMLVSAAALVVVIGKRKQFMA